MIQSVNLYTEDMRPRHNVLTLNQISGAALLALVLVTLAVFYAGWQADEAATARQSAEARVAVLQADVTAAGERLQRRVEDPGLRLELEQLHAALQNHDDLVKRVERLAAYSTEGFSPLMLGLSRQAVDGVWLTALEVDRESGNLALDGLTRDGSLVPFYLEQLSREEAFAGRRFRYFRLDRPEDRADVLGFRVATQVGDRETGK